MKRLLALVAVAVALLVAGAVSAQTRVDTSSDQVLSKKELQRLAAEATTPEEHTKLSEYYLKSAESREQEAADYDAMATSYAAHSSGSSKTARRAGAAAVQGAQHCRNLAALARKAAAEDRALASLHANHVAEKHAR